MGFKDVLARDTICVHEHSKNPLNVVWIVSESERLVNVFEGIGDAKILLLKVELGLTLVLYLESRHLGVVLLSKMNKLEAGHAEDEYDYHN